MKYTAFIFLLICGACKTKPHQDFVIVTTGDEEWTHYEGQWTMDAGVVIMRLALKTGAQGLEAQYKLSESVLKENWARGSSSHSNYSTYFGGGSNNSMGIVLHNLSKFSANPFFRYSKSADLPEEMFFITRGQNELLPCDPNFKPLTTDKRYTLHRRSELFTVEGYITFDGDSVDFYERNTAKRYHVANLAEFSKVEAGYKKWATTKHEGVYVKALAYTVVDSTARRNSALVFKRLLMLGAETEAGLEAVSQLDIVNRNSLSVKK
jgi:hypothetical protein